MAVISAGIPHADSKQKDMSFGKRRHTLATVSWTRRDRVCWQGCNAVSASQELGLTVMLKIGQSGSLFLVALDPAQGFLTSNADEA